MIAVGGVSRTTDMNLLYVEFFGLRLQADHPGRHRSGIPHE